jgi:hypothetical protein
MPETVPESWFIGKHRVTASQWFADMLYEVSRSAGTNFLRRSFRFVKAILHLRNRKRGLVKGTALQSPSSAALQKPSSPSHCSLRIFYHSGGIPLALLIRSGIGDQLQDDFAAGAR